MASIYMRGLKEDGEYFEVWEYTNLQSLQDALHNCLSVIKSSKAQWTFLGIPNRPRDIQEESGYLGFTTKDKRAIARAKKMYGDNLQYSCADK